MINTYYLIYRIDSEEPPVYCPGFHGAWATLTSADRSPGKYELIEVVETGDIEPAQTPVAQMYVHTEGNRKEFIAVISDVKAVESPRYRWVRGEGYVINRAGANA